MRFTAVIVFVLLLTTSGFGLPCPKTLGIGTLVDLGPDEFLDGEELFKRVKRGGIELRTPLSNDAIRPLKGKLLAVYAWQKDLAGPGYTRVVLARLLSAGRMRSYRGLQGSSEEDQTYYHRDLLFKTLDGTARIDTEDVLEIHLIPE